jgi:hypothetical protein
MTAIGKAANLGRHLGHEMVAVVCVKAGETSPRIDRRQDVFQVHSPHHLTDSNESEVVTSIHEHPNKKQPEATLFVVDANGMHYEQPDGQAQAAKALVIAPNDSALCLEMLAQTRRGRYRVARVAIQAPLLIASAPEERL